MTYEPPMCTNILTMYVLIDESTGKGSTKYMEGESYSAKK